MLFLSKQKNNKELSQNLTEVGSDTMSQTHYSFFMITQDDPDSIANKLRRDCLDFHNVDRYYEFHLLDFKQMSITYYGHGKMREVHLNSEIDLKMAHALSTLNEKTNEHMIWAVKSPRDYAWIKRVIECGFAIGQKKLKFDSTTSFITYLKQDLGVSNIELSYESTFNKYYKEVKDNRTFPFHYKSHRNGVEIDVTETNRRNAIVSKFINLMNQ